MAEFDPRPVGRHGAGASGTELVRGGLLLGIMLGLAPAHAAVIASSGTVVQELNPFPPASDSQIFVFDERQDVAFVDSQRLDFGNIAPGTRVNSHYLQFDPVSPTGFVGTGTVTFDGPILGVITATQKLNEDLNPDVDATSDEYFGLAAQLGAYLTGADPGSRGLGSAEDDLIFTLGEHTLTVESLEIPVAGNLDGFRVLTGVVPVDSDGDGIADNEDNCTAIENSDQRDTNADGIGNACDADLNDDCSVNFADLAGLKAAFIPLPYNPDADFNGDGFVNFGDLAVMKSSFFTGTSPGPGPSGVPNDCD